jgi:hypothetical protein
VEGVGGKFVLHEHLYIITFWNTAWDIKVAFSEHLCKIYNCCVYYCKLWFEVLVLVSEER